VDRGPAPAFGELLRRHRAATGLTQEELAERAGVSPRSIGDLEREISRAPHRETVVLLADALGLTGEPGIGKTCLLSEASRRAAGRGWCVLIGDLREAQHDHGAAHIAYGEALAIVEPVAAYLQDARLREAVLTSPRIQHIPCRLGNARSMVCGNGRP
jgi:transcriptional regulator with XRE-family HTH domain